ncbi:hypothetical protein AA0113_g3704 [Alternaria arborescens]|uniref:Uncharacterized protein n=1 Tax=Alternaria arborescens TaxID=156630 RepID=A0A4Q4SH41_9PLEO|nr:hypothetical protein AA0113_g3704 [Alternaria arborescens]
MDYLDGTALNINCEEYGKTWNRIFDDKNRKKQDRPFLECLQQEKVERDPLDAFLENTDSSILSQEVQKVKKILDNILRGSNTPAWVECRRKASNSEERPRNFTPVELARFIKSRSTSDISDGDVIRRLIFIRQLDLDFVYNLATTSSWNEVLALRPAIRRHLMREAAINVHVPHTGFATFRLELSLPYLILEKRDRSQPSTADEGHGIERLETDLAFLDTESGQVDGPARFSIWKAHETVLVFGCDTSEWTGYAFSARCPSMNEGQDLDHESDDEDDNNDGMLHEDLFATGDTNYDDQQILDANSPIWDPRVYFLCVLAIRAKIIYEQYVYLIRTLASGIEGWIRSIYAVRKPWTVPNAKTNTLQWGEEIDQIQEVLHALKTHLQSTLAVWARFSGVGGDISFFSDMVDTKSRCALRDIREIFADLMFQQQKLAGIDQTLDDATKALKRASDAQNHQLAQQTLRLNKEINTIALDSQRSVAETNRTTKVNVQVSEKSLY